MDPNISKAKWTLEEDLKIVRLFCLHGNSWSKIAKNVEGRTNDAIKNRFNSNLSKKLHDEPFSNILDEFVRKQAQPSSSSENSTHAEELSPPLTKDEPMEFKDDSDLSTGPSVTPANGAIPDHSFSSSDDNLSRVNVHYNEQSAHILAFRHQSMPNKAYCIPNFNDMIS